MDADVNFENQYCSSYKARFSQMRELILGNPEIKKRGLRIRELKDDLSEECIVIGTLFLVSKAKPSILWPETMANVRNLASYINDDSSFKIEDHSGSLKLEFAPGFDRLYSLASGLVLGYVGMFDEFKTFMCTDVIFPKPIMCSSKVFAESVVFISNCMLNQDGNMERMRVIYDYCRDRALTVVLIGNLFAEEDAVPQLSHLDQWIKNCDSRIKIIPGLGDPTSKMLPQTPLHEMLFSKPTILNRKNAEGAIEFLSNPACTSFGPVDISILSGQIISDLAMYVPGDSKSIWHNLDDGKGKVVRGKSAVKIMAQIIKTRHLAPTAPDSLSCVPYSQGDPFIIDKCDYLVAGSCEEFVMGVVDGHCLLAIPDFNLTGEAVLFNIQDKSYEIIKCSSL